MNKESLRKLTIEELRGQLVAAKENYRIAAAQLAVERQAQLAKAKAIRGKGSKQKQALIEQILKMERETQRVKAKINQIKAKAEMPLNTSYIKIGKIKVQSIKGTYQSKVKAPKDPALQKGSEMWAAIKVYKDNVKRGAIKEKNDYESLSSDEQADYSYEIMTEEDYKKYIKLENEKAKELEAQDIARAEEFEKRMKEVEKIFGF